MQVVLIALLRLYQKTLSPDHGFLRARFPYGCCRFYPTCSTYAIEVIQVKGSARGLFFACARVLRCHPWAKSRIDHPS